MLDKIDELNDKFTGKYDNMNMNISLDVISMYPSDNIDMLRISERELENDLNIFCYNYEIQFNRIRFKQMKGVPIGTLFVPPFSIIYLNCIEQQAIDKLKQFGITSDLFYRYIDDIIFGVVEITDDICQKNLDCFNIDVASAPTVVTEVWGKILTPFFDFHFSKEPNTVLKLVFSRISKAIIYPAK